MKHWKKLCAFSLVHFMAFPEMQSGEGNFVTSIDWLAELDFFGALEMGLVNTPADSDAVRRAAEKHGLQIAVGVLPFILNKGIDLNLSDPQPRIGAVQQLLPPSISPRK